MLKRKFLTWFTTSTAASAPGKKSLYSGHISTRAATQKAAPPRTLKPKVEPLDFLRCFDLVVNLFSVTLLFECQPPENARKPLKNGQCDIGDADLKKCHIARRLFWPGSPPRRARLARPAHALIPTDPRRKAPFSRKFARSNAPLARLPLLQSAAASATIAA